MSGLTTRRRYANSAAESALSVAIDASVTSYTVTTTTGFPPVPFTATLDYQGPAEEVVLVTGLSGLTITNCVRGFDSTAAQSHPLGSTFVHSLVALDLDEANDHTSSTSAHGVTGELVGDVDAQTLTSKTISSSRALATATDPAFKLQAAGSGTANLLEGYDSAGTGLLARVGRGGDALFAINDPAKKPVVARGAAAQTANLLEAQDSTTQGLWLVDAKGRITHKPSDLSTPAVKYVPPSAAAGTYLTLRNSADSSDRFLLSLAGEILAAAKIWLQGIASDDPIRFPLDGSKFKVDLNGNVAANNLPTVRPADKGKLFQFDQFTVNFSGTSTQAGVLTFPTPFGAAPDAVWAAVQCGSQFDLIHNWTTVPSATLVAWRVFQRSLASFTGSATVHWGAVGQAA